MVLAFVRKWKARLWGEVLLRGATGTFAVKLVGAFAAMALQLLLTNCLGLAEYGHYTYALSIVTIALLLSKLGLDLVMVRFIPAYEATKNWALLSGALLRLPILALTISIAIAALIYSGTFHQAFTSTNPTLLVAIRTGCYLLPLLTLLEMWQAGLRAFRRVILASLPRYVLRPLSLTSIVVVWVYMLGHDVSAVWVIIANIAAALIALIVAGNWLKGTWRGRVQTSRTESQWKPWIATSLPLLLMSGLQVINANADILMIGAMEGTSSAGIYAVAVRVSEFLLFGLTAVNAIAAPIISRLYAGNDQVALQRTAMLAAGASILFTVPAAIFTIVFSNSILQLFGVTFVAGHNALILLVAGSLVSSLFGSVGLYLTMTQYQFRAALYLGIGVLSNLGLNTILIPAWGIDGAAVANLASTVVWNSLMYIEVRRSIGIDPSVFSVVQHV